MTYVRIFQSILLLVAVIATSVIPVPTTYAQTDSLEQSREILRAELEKLEQEIKVQQVLLSTQKKNSQSIQGEIDILRTEIDKKKLEISRKNTLISQLSGEIGDKENTIERLNSKEERQREALAQLLRNLREVDDLSVWEFLLSDSELSEFFASVDDIESITQDLQVQFYQITDVRHQTEEERKKLEEKRKEEADIKASLEYDKQSVERKEDEQEVLLNDSKNKEKTYEQVIAEREARAAAIRATLFELTGLQQGANGIPFGTAYEYAKIAQEKTGVRAAFILAILKQESNLGKNVGTCNRPGDVRTWRDIMPGPEEFNSGRSWRDDQTAYLGIVKKLGIPADGQPLSCPLASGGWGGAMGPSQFIPTTWLSYEGRVASATGASLANPWNPFHAITATALYTMDLGANAGGYTAEREAACKYYSGRGCSDPNVRNAFYGNSVVAIADQIQADIDVLEGN